MESIRGSQPAMNARRSYGRKERQMRRFDSKNSGTKLLRNMTSIFCVDIPWKASGARKTVTPFVESVKNTQLSGLTVLVKRRRRYQPLTDDTAQALLRSPMKSQTVAFPR